MTDGDWDDGETSENAAVSVRYYWIIRRLEKPEDPAHPFEMKQFERTNGVDDVVYSDSYPTLETARERIPDHAIKLPSFPGDPKDLLELWA